MLGHVLVVSLVNNLMVHVTTVNVTAFTGKALIIVGVKPLNRNENPSALTLFLKQSKALLYLPVTSN